ncbi:mast cell protease 1A-like [Oreochromis niloticus]|uniref:Mast cell protease 1A-like n=1 Tax=Oreochromis niloticus TaxID=8128 RepID=I3J278_ORENI|nr:mast cell protease 1A-like [Oreochromis niloticus]
MLLPETVHRLANIMHGLQKLLLFHLLACLGHGSAIIHGEKAAKNSMLYMVSVQNKQGHICGGFLITEDFVVTAAHCDNENLTHVVLGSHNLNDHHEKIEIKKSIKFENYRNVQRGDDIMLLKLSRKVQLDRTAQIIQLPHAEIKLQKDKVCQVAGWGFTENYALPNELRVVNVSVIQYQLCKKKWPNLPDNVICAGGYRTNKGFCQRDSGGPLVCNGFAVGVVSFNKNLNCKYPDAPNVYTDISKYRQWIDKILRGVI